MAGYSVGSILDIMEGVRPLCSTIYMDLGGPNAKPTSKPFQQNLKETQVVPIGPKGGVGAVFGWRLPSIAVKFFKAKDFMIGKVPGMVQGTDYVKA